MTATTTTTPTAAPVSKNAESALPTHAKVPSRIAGRYRVVRLIARGFSNPRIADRLGISEHTVHRHVANILNKLSVSSRAAAVAQAARRGLLG